MVGTILQLVGLRRLKKASWFNMKFYRETTFWDAEYTVPNHIYLLNNTKDKMYGYLPAGSDEPVVVKKPYQFSSRGRSFVEVTELGEIE